MPFNWETKNISHLQVIHEEIFFPKNFTEMISPSYKAQINGIDVFKSNLQIDDYSDEDGRIIHFILLQDHVKFFKNTIKKQLAEHGIDTFPDKIYFQLVPNDELIFPVSVLTVNGEYQIDLSWVPKEIMSNSETKFVYTVRNGENLELEYNSNFDFVVSKDGEQIHRSAEQTRIGGGAIDFVFPSDGQYTIIFDKIRNSESFTSFTLIVGQPTEDKTSIPDWIKNNAGWWAEGQIDDSAFLQGIQFLINEGIMIIPSTETTQVSESQEVPSWIKNNAGWWAEGQIDDNTFVSGIQYLVKVGIIILG
jgi:hypothetical protein